MKTEGRREPPLFLFLSSRWNLSSSSFCRIYLSSTERILRDDSIFRKNLSCCESATLWHESVGVAATLIHSCNTVADRPLWLPGCDMILSASSSATVAESQHCGMTESVVAATLLPSSTDVAKIPPKPRVSTNRSLTSYRVCVRLPTSYRMHFGHTYTCMRASYALLAYQLCISKIFTI